MQQVDGNYLFSATDLTNHLHCDHLTTLDAASVNGRLEHPTRSDLRSDFLAEQGLRHEKDYVESLKEAGHRVVMIPEERGSLNDIRNAARLTRQAMARGATHIYQATFIHPSVFQSTDRPRNRISWIGHADLIVKTQGTSRLGNYHYEDWDAKLALSATPAAILQTSHYSWQLEQLQQLAPRYMYVITGDKQAAPIPVDQFSSLHLALMKDVERRTLELRVERAGDTYPLPVDHCPACDWRERCGVQWAANDDPTLMAGMDNRKRAHYIDAAIPTIHDIALIRKNHQVPGIGQSVLNRDVEVAKLTVEHRKTGKFEYEIKIPTTPGEGLARLPERSSYDLYLDLEGGPTNQGPLQYIWGIGEVGPRGAIRTRQLRALNEEQEKRRVEQFIDQAIERFNADQSMHIFHYGSYEQSWLSKLVVKHNTRREEFRKLQEAGVFVDVHRIVHEALRIQNGFDGLKDIEPLIGKKRTGEIVDAAQCMIEMSLYFETGKSQHLWNALRYNKVDVHSLVEIVEFLETTRAQLIKNGHDIPRPDLPSLVEAPTKVLSAKQLELIVQRKQVEDGLVAIKDLLTKDLPLDRSLWTAEDKAKQTLADLADWHRREAAPEWAEFFRRQQMSPEELFEDAACIGGLTFIEDNPPQTVARSYIRRYSFDQRQVHSLDVGDAVIDPATGGSAGEIVAIHLDPKSHRGTLELKRGFNAPDPALLKAIIPTGPVAAHEAKQALLELAHHVVKYGFEKEGRWRAACDVLLRRPPRINGHRLGAALVARDPSRELPGLVQNMNSTALTVQGPPGTGKTYIAAHTIISALQSNQWKVGICASTHSAITTDVDTLIAAAQRTGVDMPKIHQKGKDSEISHSPFVKRLDTPTQVAELATKSELSVLGGTSWTFSDSRLREANTLDLLVIDEASQIALAYALPAMGSARNVLILGDQRQLEQPIRGSHPGDSAMSLLEYISTDDTIEPTHGVFLDKTYRMAPALTKVVSGISYNERLSSHISTNKQTIFGKGALHGSGTRLVLVDHVHQNHRSSIEEAEIVRRIVEELTGNAWLNADGETRVLTPENFLLQSPWNAQVNLLSRTVQGNPEVSSVDKAQGREAPVGVYSLATSAVDDAPRGPGFLLSRNRLNTAISRARILSVVVMSKELLGDKPTTREQMVNLNAFVRLAQNSLVLDQNLEPMPFDFRIKPNLPPISHRTQHTAPAAGLNMTMSF